MSTVTLWNDLSVVTINVNATKEGDDKLPNLSVISFLFFIAHTLTQWIWEYSHITDLRECLWMAQTFELSDSNWNSSCVHLLDFKMLLLGPSFQTILDFINHRYDLVGEICKAMEFLQHFIYPNFKLLKIKKQGTENRAQW